MAKTAHAQIDLAQTVEQQQKAGPYRRMLELPAGHELKRRQRADFEQAPTSYDFARAICAADPAEAVKDVASMPEMFSDDGDKLMLPSA